MRQKSVLAILLLITLSAWNAPSGARASTLPDNFKNELVLANLNLPTDFAFAPDGRVFITEQGGKVVVFKNNQLLAAPALALNVGSGGDRGLLAIALDPAFSTNNYVYLFYTSNFLHQRISRFKMNGDVIDPSSEDVLLENPSQWSGHLNAGDIRFGSDGKLYGSFGSNDNPAQDPTYMDGKVVRINSDGSIPQDNPFVNTSGAQKSVYAVGFRNPWRFNVGPDGKMMLGDVGENTWEKIEAVQPGANYGWPAFEGSCTPNCNGVTPPMEILAHNGQGMAVVGGDFNTKNNFPTNYKNNYFFGDFVQGYIKNISFDANGNPGPIQNFDSGDGALASINFGPDGCLWYVDIFPGELHEICYGGAVAPQSVVGSDVKSGQLPLTVNFSSAQSSGNNLAYLWDFGDGSTSNQQNPAHVYTTQGIYNAQLTLANSAGTSHASIQIWAGYSAPAITITAPLSGNKYNAGDTINYAATAVDGNGNVLPPSAFEWKLIPHNGENNDSPTIINGAASGTFVIPTTADDEPDELSSYQFHVIVTDSNGLSSESVATIYPNLSTITVVSNPAGLQVGQNRQVQASPLQFKAVVGFNYLLSADSPQILNGTTYTFNSWSDGGTQTHVISAPATDTTYMANFSAVANAPCAQPANNAFNGCYFGNPDLTKLMLVRTDPVINFDWSGIAPDPLIQHDNYSVRWLGNFNFDSADYDFNVTADDGVRLYIDNNLVLDKWVDQPPTTYVSTNTMAAGTHLITMEYYQRGGGAVAKLSWGKHQVAVPLVFSDKVNLDAAAYTPGMPVNLTTTIHANQDMANVLLDTEVYAPDNTKQLQKFTNVNLSANSDYSTGWTFNAPGVNNYLVKVGLFAADWSKLYYWDSTSGTFRVDPVSGQNPGQTPPPQPLYQLSAKGPGDSFAPGTAIVITSTADSNTNLPNALLDTEIYDASGNRVMQNSGLVSLTAGQAVNQNWNLNSPAGAGNYVVKVGLFASDWSKLYSWDNDAFRFSVNSAAGNGGGQSSGLPINILQPQDGSSVQGTVNVKAVLPGQNINSYNIGWRTGGSGAFHPLVNDPGQSFKQTYIDFTGWTWHADNNYDLEFQATDLNNSQLGDTVIHINASH